MSLNEQLAEFVMGWEPVGKGTGCHFYFPEDRRHILAQDWNPTEDLNQLRMCYEAAEKDWDARFPAIKFGPHMEWRLKVILGEEVAGAYDAVNDWELVEAWVKHPELVAQAILKAKGVS